MHSSQEAASRILNTLRFRPKGMTISEISHKTGMNRNSVAKYLEILLISGQVTMDEIGNAKVYTLSRRVPISAWMDTTSDGILILDTDLGVIRANDRFLHLAGAKRDDVINQPLPEIAAEVPVISAIYDILAEGDDREVTVEAVPVRCGDERRYYRTKCIPTVFEDGRRGATVILEDTTIQTKTHALEALLACIVDSSDDAIIGEDLDGTIVSWNPGAYRLYGYPAEEAIGRPISLLFPPEREGELLYLRDRVRRGERVEHFETVRIAKDGSAINVSVTLSPILDQHSEIIGVSTITRNISTQKAAEAKIDRANWLLSGIIDSLPDATFVVDTEGRIIAWNREMEALTSLVKRDALGKDKLVDAVPFYRELLGIMNGCAGAPEGAAIQTGFRRTGDTVVSTGHCPGAYGGKGAYLWAKVSSILDQNGDRIGSIASIRDITDLSAAEERLRQSERRLRLAVTHAPFALSVIDRAGHFICCNKTFADVFGYTPDDLPPGKELLYQAFPDPPYRREVHAAWKEFVCQAEKGLTESRTCRVRCRDGELKIVIFRAAPLTEGTYLLTCEDLSEARRIFSLLLSEMLEMRRAGGGQEISEQTGAAVALTDPAGYISFINPVLLGLWGYTVQEELLNRHATELWDDPGEASDIFARVRQGADWCGMMRGRARDGTAFPVLVTADPIGDETGRVTALVLAAVPLNHSRNRPV